MESLSERYGWTPEQIRNQRVDDLQAYMQIIEAKEQERERERRKQDNIKG